MIFRIAFVNSPRCSFSLTLLKLMCLFFSSSSNSSMITCQLNAAHKFNKRLSSIHTNFHKQYILYGSPWLLLECHIPFHEGFEY